MIVSSIQEYWRPSYHSDGQQLTGLAMTLWLTMPRCVWACCWHCHCPSPGVRRGAGCGWQGFTYLFRGTPLYIQLLIFYTGICIAVREQPWLDGFFREALNCTYRWRSP